MAAPTAGARVTRRDLTTGQRFRYLFVDDDGELRPDRYVLRADGVHDVWPDGERRSATVPLAYAYKVEIVAEALPC